jgi:hypothetical protein
MVTHDINVLKFINVPLIMDNVYSMKIKKKITWQNGIHHQISEETVKFPSKISLLDLFGNVILNYKQSCKCKLLLYYIKFRKH